MDNKCKVCGTMCINSNCMACTVKAKILGIELGDITILSSIDPSSLDDTWGASMVIGGCLVTIVPYGKGAVDEQRDIFVNRSRIANPTEYKWETIREHLG